MDPSRLKIHTLVEDPARHERVICDQQALSPTNPQIRSLLESIFLELDRAASFQRFLAGYELKTILKLLGLFGVSQSQKICEIGGGPGFLSWALSSSGFDQMHLMEPNGEFNTGTGYLRSRADSSRIKIHNNMDQWHAGPERYPVVITKNCIHHFKNITQAAASIRQKMTPNGVWLAFREWFAETPQELYSQISSHPYCQPHGLYEWPYPAWQYIENIELAGFKARAVIPAGYANNTLALYQENTGGPDIESLTAQIDELLKRSPQATVESFWQEVLRNRFQNGATRFFSRPQAMIFSVSDI